MDVKAKSLSVEGGILNGSSLTGTATIPITTKTLAAPIAISGMTASSIVVVTVVSDDTTLKSLTVQAGAGSFNVIGNAASTAAVNFNYFVAKL